MSGCIITARNFGTAKNVDFQPSPVLFVRRGSKGCLWLVPSVVMEVIRPVCGISTVSSCCCVAEPRLMTVDAPLNLPPVDSAGHLLSNVPSNDRDYLPLYGYGTSHESSTNIMGGDRTSGETARSDGIRRQTVLGWTGCPKGCGCKCRIVPIERELEEL
jgi:hypothetical protein